jgi:sn-glycerol 3-phosphate transport system permease protein
VLLPLTRSTIGALVVINFIYIWNQYLWPLMATNSKEMRVVQIGIKMLMSTESTNNWGVIMAGVIITMVPPLLVFIIMQESFMKGFALQSDK